MQNKQFPPSYEVFVHKKLMLLLFNIRLILISKLLFTCFMFFVLQKFLLKRFEIVLIYYTTHISIVMVLLMIEFLLQDWL